MKEPIRHIFDFQRMEPWQRSRVRKVFGGVVLIAVLFLGCAVFTMAQDKQQAVARFDTLMTRQFVEPAAEQELIAGATPVATGVYLENFREMSIKNSSYRLVFLLWFRWEGEQDLNMLDHFRVYKGYLNRMTTVKDSYENGVHYQLARCDVTVSNSYKTRRFPLDSQNLAMYVESLYPVSEVVLTADTENCGVNGDMNLPGYNLRRTGYRTLTFQYDSTHGDPAAVNEFYSSEFMALMEVNRNSWGLYIKCFIALVGTTVWVLITLFINTYHRVDPLSMLPAALFGTVSNIMVGANLVPDALEVGLLEYVNFWGIYTILIVAFAVINVNRIRNKYEDREFAGMFGRLMFRTVLVLVLIGHIVLPLSAFVLG